MNVSRRRLRTWDSLWTYPEHPEQWYLEQG